MINTKGISLAEIVIGIAVGAVAGFLVINLLVSSNKVIFDQSAQILQGLSLNEAKLEITSLIKSSAGVAIQYPEQGAAQFSGDSDTLILKLPAIDSNGDVLSGVFDYAVIEPDTQAPAILRSRIIKDNFSSRKPENKVLSTSLESFKVSYLDSSNNAVVMNQAVRINFVIKLSTKSGLTVNESSGSGIVNIKNL